MHGGHGPKKMNPNWRKKYNNHLSRSFLWCLSQDLQGYRVPLFGRTVCLGSRDSAVLVENNEGSCLPRPKRLQLCKSCSIGDLLAHHSPWDDLGQWANPAWSLPGARPFHLQLACLFPDWNWHQGYFGPPCQGHLEFACLGLPFCTVPPLEVTEEREMWEAVEGYGGRPSPLSATYWLWEPLMLSFHVCKIGVPLPPASENHWEDWGETRVDDRVSGTQSSVLPAHVREGARGGCEDLQGKKGAAFMALNSILFSFSGAILQAPWISLPC